MSLTSSADSELIQDAKSSGPGCRIQPTIRWGHVRLLFRWSRFAVQSLFSGYFDFVGNAVAAQAKLLKRWCADVFLRRPQVECNVCGWQGRRFYPNVGPGYFERETTCPACLSQDRHRALVIVLDAKTDFFSPQSQVVEVAPMRTFQQLCLHRKENQSYISFDLERFAMEKGDITAMRYENGSLDYFLAFHVLEHIPAVDKAVQEIHRVLKLEGCAVLQVPIDWSVEKTYEYDVPDPREVGHVRRYGHDFGELIEAHGFRVEAVKADECVSGEQMEKFGLSTEPIYLAYKVEKADS